MSNKEMIKRVIGSVVFTIGVCALLIITSVLDTHYSREAIVVESSVQDQEVTVKDNLGNYWTFYGDGYVKGNKVKMLMYNNHTDDIITDDIVKDVKVIVNNK